ncbi:MAG TPA: two-component system response regulator KdpE [Burkholderiales bacterium]|nr:two-component system response regulator KdpE [Burkholderiales bacterium]
MNRPASAVLIVEDEKPIRRFVRAALESEGLKVFEAETGRQGLVEAATRKPDLVVLDLGLPDLDGVDFICGLRAWSAMPVIVLSARAQEPDKIGALDAGADDYLTKPFGVGELLARVRAALRRVATGPEGAAVVRFGRTSVDLGARVVTRGGAPVHLTALEYRLLAVLARNLGKVLTHRQLLREVWGPSYIEQSHYLRIYMAQLRHKLEDDPAQPRYLLTEIGVGYRLSAE